MQLTGGQKKTLFHALLNAFPSVANLERMVSFQLEETLSEIAGGENLRGIMHTLIVWAETQGKLQELIAGACAENPHNPYLNKFVSDLNEKNIIFIPVVVAAMNAQQAGELYDDSPDIFELTGLTREDIISHYAEKSEDWKPYTFSGSTIKEAVEVVIDHLKEKVNIIPDFCYEYLLCESVATQREVKKNIRNGGIIIADALSLFCVEVRSQIEAVADSEHVAMLVLSPIDHSTIPINSRVRDLVKSQMKYAGTRFFEDMDRLSDIHIGNLRSLQTSLIDILEKEAEFIKASPLQRNLGQLSQKIPDGPKSWSSLSGVR